MTNKCNSCNKVLASEKSLKRHQCKKMKMEPKKTRPAKKTSCKVCKKYITGKPSAHTCIKVKRVDHLTYKTVKKLAAELRHPLALNTMACKLGFSTPEIICMHVGKGGVSMAPERMLAQLIRDRPSFDVLQLANIFRDMSYYTMLKGININ